MSSSSSTDVVQEVEKIIQEDTMPGWLDGFLEKTFFDKCPTHEDMQRNDLNRYCITCDRSICRYCVTSEHHAGHKLLTIYRHVYQDAVPLCEMQIHANCQNIQHYKCNKKLVVSLHPLPHNGSGALLDGDGACIICKRKLPDCGKFHFCSVACKLQARKGEIQPGAHGASTSQTRDEVGEIINYRKRSRKGVPHRAPFF